MENPDTNRKWTNTDSKIIIKRMDIRRADGMWWRLRVRTKWHCKYLRYRFSARETMNKAILPVAYSDFPIWN